MQSCVAGTSESHGGSQRLTPNEGDSSLKFPCRFCSLLLASRNLLFAHLREGLCLPPGASASDIPHPPSGPPLHRVALHLGYIGTAYHGNSRNSLEDDTPTVEAALWPAIDFARNVCFDRTTRTEFEPYATSSRVPGFSRCSRTDRGVHAIANVLTFSCELPSTDADALAMLLREINNKLPPDIFGLGIVPVLYSDFDARRNCERRNYEYLVPITAFCTPDERERGWDTITVMKRVKPVFKRLVGKHRFHNFAQGVTAEQPNSLREVMRCYCMHPTQFLGGQEYVVVAMAGRSFMLNQLRKMIGCVIAVVRGVLPLEYLTAALDPSVSLTVPTAPGTVFDPRRCLIADERFRCMILECCAVTTFTAENLLLVNCCYLRCESKYRHPSLALPASSQPMADKLRAEIFVRVLMKCKICDRHAQQHIGELETKNKQFETFIANLDAAGPQLIKRLADLIYA